MIDFLQGTLVVKEPTRVVIDCAGIGYEAFIPFTTHELLPPAGDRVRLLTILQVREDGHTLYGFAGDADRSMFRLLVGVSGVGPKIALAALSRLAAADLAAAIASGDVDVCRCIPGVGRRLAIRITTELRDTVLSQRSAAVAGIAETARPDVIRDAELALVAIGFRPDAARRAVADAVRSHTQASSDLETLIRAAING